MPINRTILVYEHSWLNVGQTYNNIMFEQRHFNLLADYLTLNPNCSYYQLFNKRIKFNHYVGVIKLGDLSIEVLPKSDRYNETSDVWRNVLLQMLAISLRIQAKTTTKSDIQVKRHSVLETYLQLFLDETERIFREGVVKKYRNNQGEQLALKGKLLVHKQITRNLIHAERFYVSHQVYDRDNIFNAILYQTLLCIISLDISGELNNRCKNLLMFFPECKPIRIKEKMFSRLVYSRKTDRYKQAVDLARIILLNYHPDLKGGSNNILAIMLDMNLLWENFVFTILRINVKEIDFPVLVEGQRVRPFWRHPGEFDYRLKPDIILRKINEDNTEEVLVLDTKWKYRSDTSIADVRQMYAYGHYFDARNTILLYPDKLEVKVIDFKKGAFYTPGLIKKLSNQICGLMFIDLFKNKKLNLEIGAEILKEVFSES